MALSFLFRSGDSRGRTSFWNGRNGTLIDSIQSHKVIYFLLENWTRALLTQYFGFLLLLLKINIWLNIILKLFVVCGFNTIYFK